MAGGLPAQAARIRSKREAVHGPHSMHRSGHRPGPHSLTHRPRPALIAWLPKKVSPVPARGQVDGHLEVRAEEGEVHDLQPPAEPEVDGEAVLELERHRGARVQRKGGDVERRPRPEVPQRPRVARPGGGDAPVELEIHAPVREKVAADEVDARLEALVDADGAALAIDRGVGIERGLEREPEGPLGLGAPGDESHREGGEAEQERMPHSPRQATEDRRGAARMDSRRQDRQPRTAFAPAFWRYWWTKAMAMLPSPTADATRLTGLTAHRRRRTRRARWSRADRGRGCATSARPSPCRRRSGRSRAHRARSRPAATRSRRRRR